MQGLRVPVACQVQRGAYAGAARLQSYAGRRGSQPGSGCMWLWGSELARHFARSQAIVRMSMVA